MKLWNTKLLEKLLLVQKIDLQIRRINETVRELQDRCMREDPELRTLKAELAVIEESLNATRAQRDMYQNTLDDIKTAIKSLMANSARAFRPRNRSSTEALRNEEEKLGTLLVEVDEQLSLLYKNKTLLEERIVQRTNDVYRLQQKPETDIKRHQNDMSILEAERESALQGVPAALVKKYDRLRSSRSGVGLTIITDGICGVCRMEMPTGITSKLLKGMMIDACPACGRMVARIDNTIEITPPTSKTPPEKTPAKKTPAKKTPAKKTPAKKAPAKKAPAQKGVSNRRGAAHAKKKR